MSIPGDDQRIAGILDDLESRAGAGYAVERAAEVADRSRAEYRSVTLASRLVASVGSPVEVRLRHGDLITGVLCGAGADWCEVTATAHTWLVRLGAICEVRGASPRSSAEQAWPVTSRLGFAGRLRRLADSSARVVMHLADGRAVSGSVSRVGADFAEMVDRTLVSVGAVEAVQVASES